MECNGTTAGLGYLEVVWIALGKSPPWPASLCPHYHAEGYGQSGLQIASNILGSHWCMRHGVKSRWGNGTIPLLILTSNHHNNAAPQANKFPVNFKIPSAMQPPSKNNVQYF
jgi:hypothetical protein